MKNYTCYLGSAAGRNYNESIDHLKGYTAYLYGKGYWDTENEKQLLDLLDRIKNIRGRALHYRFYK